MSKDTYYFSHDYNARQDPKIRKLIKKLGMEGYGAWWSIVEDLYSNGNVMSLDYDDIAYELRIPALIVESVINDYDLFLISENTFGSESIEKRINERNERSNKAREKVNQRWKKIREEKLKDLTKIVLVPNGDTTVPTDDTTVLIKVTEPPDIDTLKESKEKERIENERIENERIEKGKKHDVPSWAMNFKYFRTGIVYPFEFPSWASMWDLWIDYRKQSGIKNPEYKSIIGLQASLKKHSNECSGDLQTAIDCIEYSIAQNYTGIHLETKFNKQNSKSNGNSKQSDQDRQSAIVAEITARRAANG